MKRILALVLAMLLLVSAMAFAEDMDLTSFTDEELNGLEQAIAMEREARASAAAEAAAAAEQAEAEASEQPAFEPLRKGEYNDNNSALQQKLKDLGYLTGKVDGIFGPQTEKALMALQEDMGLEQTGAVNTEEELNMILNAAAGDGVNLLLGTNHGILHYSLIDNGFNAILDAEEEGIKVSIPDHNDEGWLVLFYDDGRSKDVLAGKQGDMYVLSFEAKTNTADTHISVSSRQVNGQENQVQFGDITVSVPDEWQRYTLSGSLNGVAATSQGIYFNLKNNVPGTEIEIRNLKLEMGSFATDWDEAPEDKGDGTNLLLGTNQGTNNYSILDNGFEASLEADDIGIKVNMASRNDEGWLVLFFDDGRSREILGGLAGEMYTLSFDAMSNMDGTEMRISHRQTNASENQISFGTVVINQSDAWQHIDLVGSLTGVQATSQGLYIDLRYNNPPDTTVYIRNLKIEKGVTATDWSAAPEDMKVETN
ncbi:MAG: peptidoglycan-binding protein [Clostridia bacterium]|nr:peptidoglycan-binding protein [Clostridia bacterium]